MVNSSVLIGYGSVGRFHARLLSSRYLKTAIVARNEATQADVRMDFPGAVVARDLNALDELGWRWEETLAVIATWGPSHAQYFHQLAGRGVRHILCEKPLANSLKEAKAIKPPTGQSKKAKK